MKNDILKYDKGAVIQFTYGEYSDFSLRGLVVVIHEDGCDLLTLLEAFLAEGDDDDRYEPDKFVSWLIVGQHVMPIDHQHVHLGDGILDLT